MSQMHLISIKHDNLRNLNNMTEGIQSIKLIIYN